MKFRTVTGAILEPKTLEVAEQLKEAGYEVVEEVKVQETKKAAPKKDKTAE